MERQTRDASLACHQLPSLIHLLFPTEFILSVLEKMQTQEILRLLRLPELGDLGQFFRSLSATTLVSVGALAAILAYWFTHRPKALQPPCNLLMQSEEVEVSRVQAAGQVVGRGVLEVEAKLAADLTQNGAENLVFPWQQARKPPPPRDLEQGLLHDVPLPFPGTEPWAEPDHDLAPDL